VTLLPIFDCLLDYICNRIGSNTTRFTVVSLQPNRELLLAFAGITAATTEADIFSVIIEASLMICSQLAEAFIDFLYERNWFPQ